ncbi:phosphopantetheine-binding protein [Streptomyces sp. NPDC127033]|uniref:phosphopantetheine-binding protein n=1 Tax=Streptomyces sp. NPDC127033 TaxID=3347110 RepID=UPI00364B87D5
MDTNAPSSADDIRAAVAALIGIEADRIPDDANLVRLGLSSLDMMRLSGRWRRGGFPVKFECLVADPTVGGWLRHIESVTADEDRG